MDDRRKTKLTQSHPRTRRKHSGIRVARPAEGFSVTEAGRASMWRMLHYQYPPLEHENQWGQICILMEKLLYFGELGY
jgi:hypothetical protein